MADNIPLSMHPLYKKTMKVIDDLKTEVQQTKESHKALEEKYNKLQNEIAWIKMRLWKKKD